MAKCDLIQRSNKNQHESLHLIRLIRLKQKTAKYPPRYDAGRKPRLPAEVNFGVNDDLKEKEGEDGEGFAVRGIIKVKLANVKRIFVHFSNTCSVQLIQHVDFTLK